ncbi:SDR family NAD(P)-dependent oxidoreductase [Scytonema sp. UIC 10036]|uniref:type I polyketide synthase n=1 Tax=Scytonema sp. UIC 10036 TaxID=2304196 RepID=UPI0012DAA41F|nr:type I polyketide synthase [Scytonema sp. UIC 10036]MUG94287.1 SDR family NAD(P)-dependent oxidoreductase [Scytonema sp. UIC 10036]
MTENSVNTDRQSLMKKALLELKEMKSQLEAVERTKKEPIALVGVGCRFPGGVLNPEAFWQLLRDGVDAVTEVPANRWDINALYDPNPETPGKMYTRYGGFISQLEDFDAQFFGIAPREAVSLDPQQRMLLEVSWEAIESANISPAQLLGSQTGVFIGISAIDYLHRLLTREATEFDAYHATGNAHSIAAGRLSYILGLTGPSIAVDTACSSSLVAVHLACQSLRNHECNLALAGGVNLLLSSEISINFSKARMLSPDGRCKTFDAKADGYVRGEGCGVIILKRLSDAIKDNDRILALIRGSAVNQDGRSSGLTVPNGSMQQAVIRQALKNGGVEASEVSYIEAHGTGTALGDPIEVEALTAVFGKNRSQDQPLTVGSLKTNIGHLEAAAGIAGLIKVMLQFQHQEIAPHLHFEHPSPHINWENLPLTVPTQRTQWSRENPRVAGVSSFGFSGTNAHVVLAQAPPQQPQPTSELERPIHLLALSAKTQSALEQLAFSYQNYIQTHPEISIADICYTANTGRSHFHYRLAIVADSKEQLLEKLTSQETAITHRVGSQPKKAFLFTGQGSQYINMGRQLYETQPIFRETLQQCNEILRPYLEPTLLEVLYPSEPSEQCSSRLDRTAYTQPALFAVEYALYKLWKSWGIEPDVVMGHSVGEYVAATVAGVFSLEDGLTLIAHRGKLMQQLPEGEMVSVRATESVVRSALAPYVRTVALAALNGLESVVISGASEELGVICQQLEQQGIKTKRLQVSHAFHSPLMTPMLEEFEGVAARITYNQPQISIVSNVTGQLADENMSTAKYWVNHVCQTVQFAASMQVLHDCEAFIEIGPKPTLLGMGRECIPESERLWLPSLRPGVPEWEQLLSSLSQLYVAGVEVDWSGFERDYLRKKVALPTYPFQRQRYWIENSTSTRRGQKSTKLHPLLDQKLRSPLSQDIFFESEFSIATKPFLAEHKVDNQVVVPGACHLSLLLGAASLTFSTQACRVENIVFPQALAIPTGEARTVQLVLSPQGSGKLFQLIGFDAANSTTEESQWLVLAKGAMSPSTNATPQSTAIEEILARCTQQIDKSEIYSSKQRQIQLGESFQWLDSVWCGEGEAIAKIKWLEVGSEQQEYQLYPGLIDSCLQVMNAISSGEETFVPLAIESFRFYQRPQTQELWCHTRRREQQNSDLDEFIVDIKLFDFTGQSLAEMVGVSAKKVSHWLADALESTDWLYEIDWQAVDLEQSTMVKGGSWLIFTDSQGIGEELAEQLQQMEGDCTLVCAGVKYQKIDQKHYQIDPTQPEHFQKLLLEIGSTQQLGIVYLWSLPSNETALSNLPTAELHNCGSVLHLVQALVEFPEQIPPHLWLVTQGTQAVPNTSESLQLTGSSLWGLGRVIALEYPEFQCVLVDLPMTGTRQQYLQALLLELSATRDAEDQIAIRQEQRYVARLVGHRATPKEQSAKDSANLLQVNQGQLSVKPDASYWITGGLGSLGMEVAGWLVEKGARHLVLTGRSQASVAARERISGFEQLGVRVLVVQADVSQVTQVEEVIKKISSELPPLRGIVHAAGVGDAGVLKQLSLERFERVMAPKVAGTLNLHSLTQNLPLEFFVCFSSMSALLCSGGEGNYGAANAFMDSLVHYRQTLGLPGLSINWGPWSLGMMTSLDSDNQSRLQGLGIGTIAPLKGLTVLEQLLNQSSAQVVAIPIDWSQFSKSTTSPFFINFVKKTEKSQFYTFLETCDLSDRKKLLVDHVCSQVTKVLGHKLSLELDIQQGFLELGMDSLTALELRNALQKSLACSLPSSLMFDYPTVSKLADYLAQEVLKWNEAVELDVGSQIMNPQPAIASSDLEDLSESEAEALLMEKLTSINF